ncbi:MAG: hypothetical protein U0164_16540 [Gemmatimonadaceae bacterium]
MSSPDIPSEYTTHMDLTLAGGVDMGLDDIRINALPPITLNSTSVLTSTSAVTTNNALSLSVDRLPRIALDVTMAMRPTRISFPVNMKFGVKSMGMELFCFHVCGESMVIVEDYVPRPAERCP